MQRSLKAQKNYVVEQFKSKIEHEQKARRKVNLVWHRAARPLKKRDEEQSAKETDDDGQAKKQKAGTDDANQDQ